MPSTEASPSTASVGSTWSKWDLHVHTPKSLQHHYGGDTSEAWEKFVVDLESLPPEFKVLGVNDYLFVDGYERLLAYKGEGRLLNIELLLPVVELRLDKFGGVVKKLDDGTYSESEFSRINLHVIFDQLDPQLIRDQFLSALAPRYTLIPESGDLHSQWQAVITPQSLQQLGEMVIKAAPEAQRRQYGSPLQEGFNNLCISFESVRRALGNHSLKGRYLTAVGKAEWDLLRWTDGSIAEKRNIINAVDLVFTAAASDAAFARARGRLIEAGVNNKLVDCSDAHTFSASANKDRIGNCFTWIKADRTFAGLRQAVYEYDQRIFIGDKPPKRVLVNANRTKFVSRLSIHRRTGARLADAWFDVDIPLNHDLVAVIGNKGSGKSALTDILALAGDTKNHANFSFLNNQRFRDRKENLAANFEGTITWADGTTSVAFLEQNPEASRVERIKYLPQSYLEALCNELAGAGSAKFDTELRQIIFTHVPEEERLDKRRLDDLLEFKVAELDKARALMKQRLTVTNEEIVSLEKRLSAQYRSELTARLKVKEDELNALEAAQPAEVQNPKIVEAPSEEARYDTEQLQTLEGQLAAIKLEEQEARNGRAQHLKHAAHFTRILQAVRNYQESHAEFVSTLAAMLSEVESDIDPVSVVSIVVDTSAVEARITLATAEAGTLEQKLLGSDERAILGRLQRTNTAVTEVRGRLSERERRYVEYQEKLARWNAGKLELSGSPDKPESIQGLKAQIGQLDTLPVKLSEAQNRRRETVRQLHRNLREVVGEYQKLYEPVRRFLQSPERQEMSLDLDFNVRIVETEFRERFLDCINRNARGSFAGIDESVTLVSECLEQTEFGDVESIIAFVEKIDDMLHNDRRPGNGGAPISPPSQLRRGQTLQSLYDVLFGLEYLSPQYSLTFNGQEISQLSPGERGLLLLVFYLLVDKDNIPLVIDQPEENLDNKTIYHVLVRCIRAAKERRQIIMVTHNPNLAVVCDAEQVINAACDKAGRKFSYQCGAIEHRGTNDAVVEVLEGTQPAFVNRRTKYGL